MSGAAQPAPTYCTCAVPLPRERAIRKGASVTVCDRCGLPVRATFGGR